MGALVEPVHGVVGRRHHGHRLGRRRGAATRRRHRRSLHRLGVPPWRRPWRVVDVDDVEVAAAEAQAGVAFPVVGEAVDAVELDRAVGVDEVAEHAAAADGGELQRVADQHEPPAPARRPGRPARPAWGSRPCRPRRRSPSRPRGGRSGDRVGRSRRCSTRSLSRVSAATPVSAARTSAAAAEGATPNTDPAVGPELLDGGARGRWSCRCRPGRRPAPGRPVPATAAAASAWAGSSRHGGTGRRRLVPGAGAARGGARPRPSRRSSSARISGVVRARSTADSVTGRPSRRSTAPRRGRGGRGRPARRRDLVGELVDPGRPARRRVDGGVGGDRGGELADQLGRPPRRLPLRQRLERPLRHRRGRASGSIDVDRSDRPADRRRRAAAGSRPRRLELLGPLGRAARRRRAASAWTGGCQRRPRARAATAPAASAPARIGRVKRSSFSSRRRSIVAGARRELRQHVVGRRRRSRRCRSPARCQRDAEAAGQLGAQAGVVEGGQGALVAA